MKTVSAMTMRRRFGGLLDEVRSRSVRMVIQRDGKPLAVISPYTPDDSGATDRASRLAALDRLSGLGERTARGRDPGRWLARERASWAGRPR